MATAVHESDVVVLASTLLGLGVPRGSGAAYRPGAQLYALLESDDFSELTIDVSGASSHLRSTLSALDAVQLAFDAAAVAVTYRIRFAGDYQERDRDPDEEAVRDRLRDLVSEAGWELEVRELRPGSFKAKLKAIKKDERTPSRLLSIAVLAAAVVSIFFPPVTAAAGVVVAVGGVGVAFAAKPAEYAKTAKEVLSEQLESRQAATREAGAPVADPRVAQLRQTHDKARSHQLDADFDELAKALNREGHERLESIDHDSVSEALQEVTLTLTKGPTPDGGSGK